MPGVCLAKNGAVSFAVGSRELSSNEIFTKQNSCILNFINEKWQQCSIFTNVVVLIKKFFSKLQKTLIKMHFLSFWRNISLFSDESHSPGTFCVKVVKQGPRGFICKYSFQILTFFSYLYEHSDRVREVINEVSSMFYKAYRPR
jgi:hypothetical protein